MTALIWESTPPPILHRPVMVLAFAGLFDASSVSVNVVDSLMTGRPIETLAHIDPDSFFDFSQHRPTVSLDEAGVRTLHWPENEFVAVRATGAARDLVVLSGIEPDVRWRTFASAIVDVAETLRCDTVVTVGAFPEAIPHTRDPGVFGSTTTAGLAARLGLSRPQYQGPTGVVGVVHDGLEQRGIPAIALRVGVPHYLGNAKHPRSEAALLRHLEHVLGFPTGWESLHDEIEQWRQLHDRAVTSDPQATAFVRMLESEFDRRAELAMPSADDLGAAFEAFLRDHHEGPSDPDPDPDPD